MLWLVVTFSSCNRCLVQVEAVERWFYWSCLYGFDYGFDYDFGYDFGCDFEHYFDDDFGCEFGCDFDLEVD